MNDTFVEFTYDKELTILSPIIIEGVLEDYANLVSHEGGKTSVKNISVINMDKLKNSLKISQRPSSMDIVFICRKTTDNKNGPKKKYKKYILADLKFNVKTVNNIVANIPNASIKAKFKFSCEYIRSKDMNTPCHDIAYFVFNDKNFEQIRHRWMQRNLNFPKNTAIKQSDFEKLFYVAAG